MADRRWNFCFKNTSNAIRVLGYSPANFDWTIETLAKRKSQLRRLHIVYELAQKEFPIVSVGCLGLPILDVALKKLCKSTNFLWVQADKGYERNERYIRSSWSSYYPVPLTFRHSLEEVSKKENIAFVDGRIFFDESLCECILADGTVDVYPAKVSRDMPRLAYAPTVFDRLFSFRSGTNASEIESKVLEFFHNSLKLFLKSHHEKLTAILFDADPTNGYIILALKTSSIENVRKIDIEDFEFEQFATIEGNALYGGTEFLRERDVTKVLKAVGNRLIDDDAVTKVSSKSGVFLFADKLALQAFGACVCGHPLKKHFLM